MELPIGSQISCLYFPGLSCCNLITFLPQGSSEPPLTSLDDGFKFALILLYSLLRLELDC